MRYGADFESSKFKGRVKTTSIKRFIKDESGATAIEYGLIAAGIAVAIIVMFGTFGDTLLAIFTNVNTELNNL